MSDIKFKTDRGTYTLPSEMVQGLRYETDDTTRIIFGDDIGELTALEPMEECYDRIIEACRV